MANPLPPPVQDPIGQLQDPSKPPGANNKFLCFDSWLRYFVALAQGVNSTAGQLAVVNLTGQQKSIGQVAMAAGKTSNGLYRVSYYARVTQAATVSSSLTVNIGWTDHGQAISQAGAAMTGNTPLTIQSLSTFLYADGKAPITYSTTYASSGATPMQYELFVVLEAVAL